ncbi:hypothetical protein JYK02_20970 [Corallococcus macrosporus]|uniref:Uncharacterized protein n=1 Tax=Corallococcus macrosporus TaxID=35 RepID=A0ABS3DFL1_9BACT|nr:hypothetical protein [Corallococcus macrosporus]MBN8229990.1 hypothetical protein [Corallococcus macrosporus]
MTHPDPAVMDLLDRVYSSSNSGFDDEGRYSHRIPATFTEADHAQLKAAGLVPNVFIRWGHDEAIDRLRQSAAKVDLRPAADAFVASMVSAGLAWLSVLPAAILGRAMPVHAEEPMGGGSCRVCFFNAGAIDVTYAAYLRHLSGGDWGVDHPVNGVLALTAAIDRPPSSWPQPTPRDVWVFHQVLELLRGLPPKARYSQARTALHKARLLSANRPSRCETVLEALAFIGILEAPEHPGLMTRFTSAIERDRRPSTNVEVPAPLAWWSAKEGLQEARVATLFGHLPRPEAEPPAPTTTATVRRKTASPAAPRPRSIAGPPTPGSVYAIQFREDLWGAAYCHEVRTDGRGILRGRMEYLDLLSPTPPTAEQVAGIGFRDRLNGERWQTWCGGLDKTPGVKRIAVDVSTPTHVQPVPERIPTGGASELRHLAGWNFKLPAA